MDGTSREHHTRARNLNITLSTFSCVVQDRKVRCWPHVCAKALSLIEVKDERNRRVVLGRPISRSSLYFPPASSIKLACSSFACGRYSVGRPDPQDAHYFHRREATKIQLMGDTPTPNLHQVTAVGALLSEEMRQRSAKETSSRDAPTPGITQRSLYDRN